jgi:hypothetical protein
MKFKQITATPGRQDTNSAKHNKSKDRSEYLRLGKIRSAIKAKQSIELSEAAVQHMAAMLRHIDEQIDALKGRLKMHS